MPVEFAHFSHSAEVPHQPNIIPKIDHVINTMTEVSADQLIPGTRTVRTQVLIGEDMLDVHVSAPAGTTIINSTERGVTFAYVTKHGAVRQFDPLRRVPRIVRRRQAEVAAYTAQEAPELQSEANPLARSVVSNLSGKIVMAGSMRRILPSPPVEAPAALVARPESKATTTVPTPMNTPRFGQFVIGQHGPDPEYLFRDRSPDVVPSDERIRYLSRTFKPVATTALEGLRPYEVRPPLNPNVEPNIDDQILADLARILRASDAEGLSFDGLMRHYNRQQVAEAVHLVRTHYLVQQRHAFHNSLAGDIAVDKCRRLMRDAAEKSKRLMQFAAESGLPTRAGLDHFSKTDH
jgi:hypothetical protein